LKSIGYKMSDIKRIILIHAHADHAQAANEIKKRTSAVSSDVQAKIYAHWIDSAYLAHNPPYHGPPNLAIYAELLAKHDLKIEDVIEKFGKLDVDPIAVDEELNDGDMIKSLKVIHTPGHMSLYLEDQRTVFGADVLWNMGNSGGLVIPPSYFTLDEVTAAVSVMKVSRLNFDILLLGYQDNPISENAQNVVEVAAKDMIHKLKQTNE
jgi:glyoxylase-like metal-dependent hydrolase (beta-lactamase superfamily II)